MQVALHTDFWIQAVLMRCQSISSTFPVAASSPHNINCCAQLASWTSTNSDRRAPLPAGAGGAPETGKSSSAETDESWMKA
jgi:hypothetical protein